MRSGFTERNVGDGPTVVGALVLAGRSGVGCAHVRGTDAYIALGDYSRVMSTECNVADGPTVVRAMAKQGALCQIALTSGGLTATFFAL